jgi:hypothetical protein
MRIPVSTDASVASAVGRLGRTEDVRFSPSGRRLALAGYRTNRLLIVRTDMTGGAG